MLYTRQLLTLGVSLYTVRITLDVLGVTDYGIYNVLAGLVTLFTFLGGSLTSATQRFFSFSLGEKNTDQLNKTFTVNSVLYAGIALLAIFLLETVGLWYVNHELKIPAERLEAAHWVYQFTIFTFAATILTTPFTAIITAHEDMHLYALASIVEAVLKLLSVVLLIYLPFEKLILYSALTFLLALLKMLVFMGICSRLYSECQFRKFYWDYPLMRKIVGFTGWSLFGQASTVGRTHAVTVLLNQMFNPSVVAARAIASSMAGQINLFASNFNSSLYPPIIKSYAEGNLPQMYSLINNGSKIAFFLLWIVALPIGLEMEMVLHLWLVDVPPDAVLFAQLALIEAQIFSLSYPLATAARAPGKMKVYELTLGLMQFGIFGTAWAVLKLGAPAYSVYIIAIVANLLMFYVRLVIVHGLTGLPIKPFIVQSVLPLIAIASLSAIPAGLLHHYLPAGYLSSGLTILTGTLLSCVSMYYLGLNKVWREKLKTMISGRVKKLTKSFAV